MTDRHDSIEGVENVMTDVDLLLGAIHNMLVKSRQPELSEIPAPVLANDKFQAIHKQLRDIRDLCSSLSKGDLTASIQSRGFIVSNLKTIQANLRHLTWQSRRIAQGDYSQTLDFLGEISDAFNDMTQKLAYAKSRLVEQAHLDALTGVPNRLALDQFLSRAFSYGKSQGTKIGILMIDIDHFKSINDTHGHLIGDEILKVISRRLQKQTRATDCFGRYGGEEFVTVLSQSDLEACKRVCVRIIEAVNAKPIILGGQVSIPVTVSIGASELMPQDSRYEDILRRSDEALYEAKQAGRGCFRVKVR